MIGAAPDAIDSGETSRAREAPGNLPQRYRRAFFVTWVRPRTCFGAAGRRQAKTDLLPSAANP
jgi:hypothetical protein